MAASGPTAKALHSYAIIPCIIVLHLFYAAMGVHLQFHCHAVGSLLDVSGCAAAKGSARTLVNDLKAHSQRLAPHIPRHPTGGHCIHALPIIPRHQSTVLQHLPQSQNQSKNSLVTNIRAGCTTCTCVANISHLLSMHQCLLGTCFLY